MISTKLKLNGFAGRRFIRNLWIAPLFVCLFAYMPAAEVVDTVIYSDGGPGPYSISKRMVDSSTIEVSMGSDSISVAPWVFISEHNSLLFSEAIDSGVPLKIRFETDYFGLSKTFSLFPKLYARESELKALSDSSVLRRTSYSERENLSVSGYKSIGVSVGSFGEINLEQGLDVRIGGQIRPGTEVSAHLSDQGSSLDGATREISEFDMIYVALTDPLYGAVAGDQYISWIPSGIFKEQKKIKGLSASLHPDRFHLSAFGALSGGIFTTETWYGRNGVQGPYNLSGNGEPGFITPIGGTVKIKLNGKTLAEGMDRDYTVDYDLGSLTFNPSVLIKDKDLIRVEYEYKLFDYQRTVLGTEVGFSSPDSIFSVKGALWSEADNRNHPIDLVLSKKDLNTLRESGDSPPMGTSERLVHHNDVSSEDALYPLYSYVKGGENDHFVHKRYDPLKPDNVSGFYNVWFTYVGEGKGDYVRTDSIVHREFVYRYAGPNQGDYSPQKELSAPERITRGEIIADLRLDLLKARVDIAGLEHDRNLFSQKDDDDNLGSSAAVTFIAGSDQIDKRGAWLQGDYLYSSRRFESETQEAYDRYKKWNDSSLAQGSGAKQIWESALGVTPVKGLSLRAGYGQNRSDSGLITDKITGGSRWLPSKWISVDYDGSYFRHHEGLSKGTGHQENAGIKLNFDNITGGVLYRDEWRADSSGKGAGQAGGGVELGFFPWKLRESVSFFSFRAGEGFLAARDTGYSFLWEQSFDHRIIRGWELSAGGNYHRNVNRTSGTTSTFLIDLISNVEPVSCGFSSRQHYRSNSEKASVFVQVPVFAGKGLGTHVFDDSLKEYVPHTPGDYFMQQREVYDKTIDTRIRKTTLEIDWEFRPLRKIAGILNDLSWHGTLFSEEHVDAERKNASSWIPGVSSLEDFFRKKEVSSGTYADLSYRQDIHWAPQGRDDLRGEFFVTPSFRKIRSYREPGVQAGLDFEYRKGRWTIGDKTGYLHFFRDDSLERDFHVRDINTELVQTLRITGTLDIYLKECAGWARRDYESTVKQSMSLDSCTYFQLSPGLSWRAFDRGFLDASYVFSVVNLPGDLDYRVARGFGSGLSQVFSVVSEIQVGKNFSVSGTYRGELRKLTPESGYEPPQHTLSLQVKAFL